MEENNNHDSNGSKAPRTFYGNRGKISILTVSSALIFVVAVFFSPLSEILNAGAYGLLHPNQVENSIEVEAVITNNPFVKYDNFTGRGLFENRSTCSYEFTYSYNGYEGAGKYEDKVAVKLEDVVNYGCLPINSIIKIILDKDKPNVYFFPGTPSSNDLWVVVLLGLGGFVGLIVFLCLVRISWVKVKSSVAKNKL